MRDVRLNAALVRRIHQRAHAAKWGLTSERFEQVLEASVAHAFRDRQDSAAIERHVESLHAEDLALATACADGDEGAWEHFVREFRPVLYRSADAIDKTGSAREAADSLYGELFGLRQGPGERRSLFRYFHGRSSLATWLRAVLSQRYVDEVRRRRRLEPLPDEDGAQAVKVATVSPERARFLAITQAAITSAVATLVPRDRLRLALYYARNLTLAQIGRTLREHEATASRQLARTRRQIREHVERQLRQEGMTDADIAECLASVAADAGTLDLDKILAGDRKNPDEDRST